MQKLKKPGSGQRTLCTVWDTRRCWNVKKKVWRGVGAIRFRKVNWRSGLHIPTCVARKKIKDAKIKKISGQGFH